MKDKLFFYGCKIAAPVIAGAVILACGKKRTTVYTEGRTVMRVYVKRKKAVTLSENRRLLKVLLFCLDQYPYIYVLMQRYTNRLNAESDNIRRRLSLHYCQAWRRGDQDGF